MRTRLTTLRIEHLRALLPFMFVLWAGLQAPLPLPDFWVYLRIGEVMTATGSIPSADLFSYTASGEPDVLLFHPQEYGDYLIFRLWRGQRTFIDSRMHLFGDAVVGDYVAVMAAGDDWEQVLRKQRVEWILLGRDTPHHAALLRQVRAAPSWTPVYEEAGTVLFTLRGEV
jgi:hypothetical protein